MDGGSLDTEVLVVGAGPTGLTLALDLARRGVRVLVVERDGGTFPGSRAKGIQPRTQEVFDDLGVVAAARAAGGPYPPMGLHLGPLTVKWVMQKPAPVSLGAPYPDVLLLPQYATTALLHAAVAEAKVPVRFGTAVVDVEQEPSWATAVLAGGERIRAAYVVGADGGGSPVRKSAGLAFEGSTDEDDRMIIVDGQIDGLSRNRWHLFPRLGGRMVGACPLPGSENFQVMIKIRPGDPVNLSEAALADLFARLVGGRRRLHHVVWSSLFRPNVRLVERYRRGRVLLAGDAAHVHTPAGAQGLNTGVQDAYNLGWKLAQVLAGAPEALLDSYEGERRPIAARVLGRSSELYAGAQHGRLDALKRGTDERQLSLSYAGGPLGPADSARTEKLRVGDRAPDAALPGGRVFDLFRGPHFTLLAFGTEAGKAMHDVAWPTRGAGLYRHQVSVNSNHSAVDRRVNDAYGTTGDTLVLVRPDGYIANIAPVSASAVLDPAALSRAVHLMTPGR